MSRIKDLNIRAKLTLVTASSAAIALFCVLIAFVVQDLRLVQHIKKEQVGNQLSALTANLAHTLAQDQTAIAVNLFETAVGGSGIVEAELKDIHGNRLIHHSLADRVDQFDVGWLPFSNRSYSRPVMWQGEQVGTLSVLVSFSDVEMRAVYLIFYSLLAFLFAIAIAVFVARLVQKIVTQPLLRLHRLTQQVAATGNYGLRARVSGHDEISQLGQAINGMLGQIEQRDVMLERQVADRTLELKRLAEEFRYLAFHDSLTGLANRTLLAEEFHRAVAHAARVKKHFAVLLLDLDNFKTINDTLGHEAGDEALKAVAQKIRQALRAEDIVCRLGGDEFVILVEDLETDAQVRAVGRSLLAAFEEPLWIAGRPVALGLSIGISLYPQHGSRLDELKDSADSAMYSAKHAGKNQFAVFNAAPAVPKPRGGVVLDDLKRALAAGQFELYYQPIVDVGGRAVVCCEALVRWRHAELGLLQPVDFIPLAEKSGLMVELDQYVLMHACRDAKSWAIALGVDLPVSVNLSAIQYQSVHLLAGVKKALLAADLEPKQLVLELPESSLSAAQSLKGALAQVRALGVKLALDNFGLGDFSLLCLEDLGLDRLKLDASFAGTLDCGEGNHRLLKGVLAMAAALEVEVVGQGVETQQQETALHALGCDVLQGFYYSEPVPAFRMLSWLERFGQSRQLQLPQAVS